MRCSVLKLNFGKVVEFVTSGYCADFSVVFDVFYLIFNKCGAKLCLFCYYSEQFFTLEEAVEFERSKELYLFLEDMMKFKINTQ